MSLQRPLVLCYHGISDDWSRRLVVCTDAFERQVRSVLRRRFRPATAAEVVERRGRLVHVTFDDAYRNIAGALAILERLGMSATVFPASAYADTGRRWTSLSSWPMRSRTRSTRTAISCRTVPPRRLPQSTR